MKTYTISELAREFEVTPRALRFYEDKGLLNPMRDGMNRVYSSSDRGRLKLILQGKSVGFSLADIREILELYKLEGHKAQLKVAIQKAREQVKVLEKQRGDIDGSLQQLQSSIKWAEDKIREIDTSDSSAKSGAKVAAEAHHPA